MAPTASGASPRTSGYSDASASSGCGDGGCGGYAGGQSGTYDLVTVGAIAVPGAGAGSGSAGYGSDSSLGDLELTPPVAYGTSFDKGDPKCHRTSGPIAAIGDSAAELASWVDYKIYAVELLTVDVQGCKFGLQDVHRRFSDFEWLHDRVKQCYSERYKTLPKFPKKQLNKFANKEESARGLLERRGELASFVNAVLADGPLSSSLLLKFFLFGMAGGSNSGAGQAVFEKIAKAVLGSIKGTFGGKVEVAKVDRELAAALQECASGRHLLNEHALFPTLQVPTYLPCSLFYYCSCSDDRKRALLPRASCRTGCRRAPSPRSCRRC